MAMIAVTSAKGGPGVSTLCLAMGLQWPRRILLVDADPAAGDLLAGWYGGQGVAGRGLLALSVASRSTSMERELWSQVLPLVQGQARSWLLAGVAEPQQSRSVDWHRLAGVLAGLDYGHDPVDALVDMGRLRPSTEITRPDAAGPEPILMHADVVALVCPGTVAGVRAAQLRVTQLRSMLSYRTDTGPYEGLVGICLGGPYEQEEVAAQLGIPVIGQVPVDRRTADVLLGGAPQPRGWLRSALMRAGRDLAKELVAAAGNRRSQMTVLDEQSAPEAHRRSASWRVATAVSAAQSAPLNGPGDES